MRFKKKIWLDNVHVCPEYCFLEKDLHSAHVFTRAEVCRAALLLLYPSSDHHRSRALVQQSPPLQTRAHPSSPPIYAADLAFIAPSKTYYLSKTIAEVIVAMCALPYPLANGHCSGPIVDYATSAGLQAHRARASPSTLRRTGGEWVPLRERDTKDPK